VKGFRETVLTLMMNILEEYRAVKDQLIAGERTGKCKHGRNKRERVEIN
jgi:hypothetical protein